MLETLVVITYSDENVCNNGVCLVYCAWLIYPPLHNVETDRSYKYGHDVVDSLGERDLSYPVQSSDSTDVKQIPHSQTENETLSGSLDSGFSRCVIFFSLFHGFVLYSDGHHLSKL